MRRQKNPQKAFQDGKMYFQLESGSSAVPGKYKKISSFRGDCEGSDQMFVQFEHRLDHVVSGGTGDFFMKIWGDFSSVNDSMEQAYQSVNSCLAAAQLFVAENLENSLDFTKCQARKLCPAIFEKSDTTSEQKTVNFETGCDDTTCTVQLDNGATVCYIFL